MKYERTTKKTEKEDGKVKKANKTKVEAAIAKNQQSNEALKNWKI